MVKIYRRSCRRSHRKGKSDYKYYRLYMPIPAEFKTRVKPFLDKELEVDVKWWTIDNSSSSWPKNQSQQRFSIPPKTLVRLKSQTYW